MTLRFNFEGRKLNLEEHKVAIFFRMSLLNFHMPNSLRSRRFFKKVNIRKWFFWLKSPKIGAKLIHLKKREDSQGSDLAPIFGGLNQSDKHSVIKPPLGCNDK